MQRNIAVFLAPFVFVLICLANYIGKHKTFDNHLDGFYILELVKKTDDGVEILPLYLFNDPQWGFYLCQTEKNNFKRHMAGRSPDVMVECFKQGDGEI